MSTIYKNHPEHQEVMDWLGDSNLDPDHFDKALINKELQRLA